MLFLHEVHEVSGRREDAFEAAIRGEWMPRLARTPGARLLYFLHHAHGSGASYRVVTITALRDAAAWGELVREVAEGSLRALAESLDQLRHDVRAKILIPLPWSKLQQIDLASVPSDARRHALSIFMEDTVWPFEGLLEQYVARSGAHYAEEMKRQREGGGRHLLTVDASFRTAYGSGRRREIVLWQKIVQEKGLGPLLLSEVPEQYKQPGTWMHDGLEFRDQWESRLLRSSSWSPWY
jgi:hypothetical protein